MEFILRLKPTTSPTPPGPTPPGPTPPGPIPPTSTVTMAWVNESQGDLSDADAAKIVEALNLQVAHLESVWPNVSTAKVRHVLMPKGSVVPSDQWPSYWLPNPDVANALGYHDVDPQGRPYTRSFTRPVLQNGGTALTGSLSIAAVSSHEGCEEAVDPSTNSVAKDHVTGWTWALEDADPTENDFYDVTLADGSKVSVSNFVGPGFFRQPGTVDYLGICKPFTLRPGGYGIVDKGDGAGWTQVFGERYPEWKRAMKEHPASRTQKRLRALRGEG